MHDRRSCSLTRYSSSFFLLSSFFFMFTEQPKKRSAIETLFMDIEGLLEF